MRKANLQIFFPEIPNITEYPAIHCSLLHLHYSNENVSMLS